MKYCEAIEIEGDRLLNKEWPMTITVHQGLLDYPPTCARFGRRGVLRFEARNGYAVYQRADEHYDGWTYRLIESEHRRNT